MHVFLNQSSWQIVNLMAGASGAEPGSASPNGLPSDARNRSLKWLQEQETEAEEDELGQLLKETQGVVEKLAARNFGFGSWQMVLWQPRHIYATPDGLHYQKVEKNEKPTGKPKSIPFASITQLDECEQCEFVIVCKKCATRARVRRPGHRHRRAIEPRNSLTQNLRADAPPSTPRPQLHHHHPASCGSREFTFKVGDQRRFDVLIGNIRALMDRWRGSKPGSPKAR